VTAPRTWRIERTASERNLDELLDTGWEPFAVVWQPGIQYGTQEEPLGLLPQAAAGALTLRTPLPARTRRV
jgi:hypothetical protein